MNGNRFTQICGQLAQLRDPFRADLHLHTHFSDGTHAPEELVQRAKSAKLSSIAVTDHDTTAGVLPVRQHAGLLEVIAGVEITCTWNSKEVHLLGYFVDLHHRPLQDRLRWIRDGRRTRILEMARRFPTCSESIEECVHALPDHVSLGRRHLARWLIEAKLAGSFHDAFSRLLNQPEIKEIPKRRLPLEEAIDLVAQAGGVSSVAHPSMDTTLEQLRELKVIGLDAVEAIYPWPTKAHSKRLQSWAMELGLCISGGSDSHDPTPVTRNVGSRTIGRADLDKLRALAFERSSSKSLAVSLG